MNNNMKAKVQTVNEIVEKLTDAKSIVFVNYQGTNVSQDTNLRNEFRKNNAEYKVYKNRLIMRALDQLGYKDYGVLEGTTAVAISKDDEIVTSRIVVKAMADNSNLVLKYGIVNGKLVDDKYINVLAKLPSKEALISQLLSVLNGPISGLARVLSKVAEK